MTRVATTRVCGDFSCNPIEREGRIWYNIQRSEHHEFIAKAMMPTERRNCHGGVRKRMCPKGKLGSRATSFGQRLVA